MPAVKTILVGLHVDVQRYPQKQDLPQCYMYTGGFYIRKTELLNDPEGFYENVGFRTVTPFFEEN